MRIKAFDWLRGLAVIVMVQTHALALLAATLRSGPLYQFLQRIDGLVAPSFIFTAGFSVALVQRRGAMQGKALFGKSALRIGEVFLVATLVNAAWFPIFRELKWWTRLDILHCITLSLSAVLVTLTALTKWPRAILPALSVIAAAIFLAAPLMENVGAPFDVFVTAKSISLFPLFPWAGYAFLGATVGVAAANGEAALNRTLGVLLVLGLGLWALSGPIEHVYPPHNYWVTNPANCGERWSKVILLVLGFRLLERRQRFAGTRVEQVLTTFGTASLSGYFFHEMLLFYPTLRLFSFSKYFDGQTSWWSWSAVLIGVWLATYGCVVAWVRVEPTVRSWGRRLVTRS